MTATPPLPLIHGHARSKATRASTASPAPAPLAAGVDGSSHPSSHVPKETRSDRAATLLIRRTLCAHRDQRPVGREGDDASPRPVLDLLPPLTSSTEVDLQLYALVAILVRDYILPWYSRVTSDREFIDEIVQVIAHCCRALERRSREVDLEALLVDEIPSLLNAHLDAYRASYPTVNAALPPDARQAFHALYPHPALSPVPDPGTSGTVEEQRRNEVAYRKLMAQRVLAVLLPAEDLENDCLRTLVEEICAETILGNVAEKGSEAWRWHHGIIALVHAFRTDTVGGLAGAPVKADGAAGKGHTTVKNQYDQVMGSVLGGFWTLLHLIWLGLAGLRFLIVAIVTSSALPTRSKPAPRATAPPTRDKGSAIGDGASMASDAPPVKRPLITMAIWSSASRLLDLDGHMPWLHGMGQLGQWGLLTGPGRVGEVDGMLDR
ncbi:MAG: hypothetical protein M1838_002295 [Thelocarpon superellum]|nr:MAG: hypothetical protein M1838_002295 [Thelocarpon superellum]